MLESTSSSLIYYPGVPMSRFGLIAPEFGGGCRYRVIWAPSRKVMLTGRAGTITVSMYGAGPNCDPQSIERLDARLTPQHAMGEVWILEQWKAPWDLYSGTKAQWEADPTMLNMGPYPAKGDYVCCQPHFTAVPSGESVEKLILLIEDGWKRKRPIDNQLAIINSLEKSERSRKATRRDMINNRSLIGSGEAYAARGGSRGTKTMNLNLTTRDINLPIASGVTSALRTKRRPVYRIPQEA